MCFVYVIGKTDDLVPPYDKCYIGVTVNPERRWIEHTRNDFITGKTIRKYNLTFEENFVILYEGSEDDCYKIENKLRPISEMGMNIATGGYGGYTRYDEERNKKVSESLKGRKVTWMSKIVESRGSYQGEKNPAAANWRFTDPDGNKFEVTGSFVKFCKEHNLLGSALRYYDGKPVPPIHVNGYGGFRAKNEISHEKRVNTIGWICEKL